MAGDIEYSTVICLNFVTSGIRLESVGDLPLVPSHLEAGRIDSSRPDPV